MERVVAYDLPIDFCRSADDAAFSKELRRDADWLSGADVYYMKGFLDVPPIPEGIDPETIQDNMDSRFRNS